MRNKLLADISLGIDQTNVSPKTYGIKQQTKGKSDKRGQKAREGHRLAGISDRPFHRADQEADLTSQKKPERFPFPKRTPQNGFQKKETHELSGKER